MGGRFAPKTDPGSQFSHAGHPQLLIALVDNMSGCDEKSATANLNMGATSDLYRYRAAPSAVYRPNRISEMRDYESRATMPLGQNQVIFR